MRVRLTYPPELVQQPVIYRLVKEGPAVGWPHCTETPTARRACTELASRNDDICVVQPQAQATPHPLLGGSRRARFLLRGREAPSTGPGAASPTSTHRVRILFPKAPFAGAARHVRTVWAVIRAPCTRFGRIQSSSDYSHRRVSVTERVLHARLRLMVSLTVGIGLLDHLIRPQQERRRDRQPASVGGLRRYFTGCAGP
jgi:hypothetical protein